MIDPLAALLLGTGPSGYGASAAQGFVCTAWDSVTRKSTVSDGAVTYVDLLCLAPSLMTTGRVLLLKTEGRPVILGPLYGPV